MSRIDANTGSAPARLGQFLRVGLSRIGYETRIYFRSADSIFFTFLFPFIMLVIFAKEAAARLLAYKRRRRNRRFRERNPD